MDEEVKYHVALTFIPHVGPVQAKILLQHLEPKEIFSTPVSKLERIEGIGPVRAASIRAFRDFSRVEKEISFMIRHQINPVFITNEKYPRRLLNCYDSPTLLYCNGPADLNPARMIAVVGTRKPSPYGKEITTQLIKEISGYGVTVISGLAYGVDAIAHKSSIDQQVPTIGVMAHGMDQVYPFDHRDLAMEMMEKGGALITEFASGTEPDKHNFPSRNRVVAGMSDAIIVIETPERGGSIITAELANSYNRDVFAFPGKVSDKKSAGCLQLIKTNRAMLCLNAKDIAITMGWEVPKNGPVKSQRELFIELSPAERNIIDLLAEQQKVHIDDLLLRSGLAASTIASAILTLEMQNLILSLPGKYYQFAG